MGGGCVGGVLVLLILVAIPVLFGVGTGSFTVAIVFGGAEILLLAFVFMIARVGGLS